MSEFWSNVADWIQGKVNEAGDYMREERPSYVDTPLYTMERDNSVANAYNNWLASERNRAAQAEAQARQAEYNAAQFGAQMAAQDIMNQFNMQKYAEAEAAKLKAESEANKAKDTQTYTQRYVDEWNKLDELQKQAGLLDEKDPKRAGMEAQIKALRTRVNELSKLADETTVKAYSGVTSDVVSPGEAAGIAEREQVAKNKADAEAKKTEAKRKHKEKVDAVTNAASKYIGKSLGEESIKIINDKAKNAGVTAIFEGSVLKGFK